MIEILISITVCYAKVELHNLINSKSTQTSMSLCVLIHSNCRRYSLYIALAIIFFLSGCGFHLGSYENCYFPVRDHVERESSLGFSIKPPSGVGWYEKLNDDSLYYLKRIGNKKYTIYTKAAELHLDQTPQNIDGFVQYVVKNKSINVDSGYYKNHSFRYSIDFTLSPYCVRYAQHYNDYGKKGLRPDEFIIVNNGGLVCMHPNTPATGVDMYYKESYLGSSEQSAKSYKKEGEHFLSSLKFQ